MEGGHPTADKTEFTECWKRSTDSPYIMRLALSAGIGGLLFGYDTGNITKHNPFQFSQNMICVAVWIWETNTSLKFL